MQDLCITEPRDDNKRIEDTKGGLFEDSYRWILTNFDFQQWHNGKQNSMLWVRGDPGKGKTMLLCGAIDELDKTEAKTNLLSYFFCQATDARINSATAVLRGLIYMLVRQQSSLISHVRKRYDQAGKKALEDANAWFSFREIFVNMLEDLNRDCAYLVVDALDECIQDLPKLLELITEHAGCKVDHLEPQLATKLKIRRSCPSSSTHNLSRRLSKSTQNTRCLDWHNAMTMMTMFDLQSWRTGTAHGPAWHFQQSQAHVTCCRALRSFLVIRKDTVYFVHQSAKDFLLNDAIDGIWLEGQAAAHQAIFTQSLPVMSLVLRRDICDLQALAYAIEHVSHPNPDPLAALRYACIFWVDHVRDWLLAV